MVLIKKHKDMPNDPQLIRVMVQQSLLWALKKPVRFHAHTGQLAQTNSSRSAIGCVRYNLDRYAGGDINATKHHR